MKNQIIFECSNCKYKTDNKDQIKMQFPNIPLPDLHLIEPGDTVPFGICPSCGKFVYQAIYGLETELRNQLLRHVATMVKYWSEVKNPSGAENGSSKETINRLDGLAFSLLVMLDGGTNVPECEVRPTVALDEEDEYMTGPNIGGCLHEYYGKFSPVK